MSIMLDSETSLYSNHVPLYKPLVIEKDRFVKAYNYPIKDFVERNTFRENSQNKGGKGKEIVYLSYAHAIRIFKEEFPELAVDCVMNPQTGSYVFQEINNTGYFMKAYVHDGERRSPIIYYGLLDGVGQNVFTDQSESDYKTNDAKTYVAGVGVTSPLLKANVQFFNKNYYRALTKAIAVTTGIGLKLWTGDDLSNEIMLQKMEAIARIESMAAQYEARTGKPYPLPELDLTTLPAEISMHGRELVRQLKDLDATQPIVIAPRPSAPILSESKEDSDDPRNMRQATPQEVEEAKPKRGKKNLGSGAVMYEDNQDMSMQQIVMDSVV